VTAVKLLDGGHRIGLILTAKEAPEYTKSAQDFKELSQKIGAHFIQTPRIEEAVNAIRSLPPMDIGVSLNYSGVIPQHVIDLFPLGILNAHGGDLPRYRGNACQAWAILNGEKRIGLCIHRMIGGELDSGDIIAREYLDIDRDTKITHAWKWLGQRIPPLFEEALTKLSNNPGYVLEQQSKDPKDALRCYPRLPEDGRIDWSKSTEEILRLINASNKPYAGAFCEYEGEKVTIWDAQMVEDGEIFLAVPGQVTRITNEAVEIATGNGKIRLLQIEAKGNIMAPSELIQSIRKRFK